MIKSVLLSLMLLLFGCLKILAQTPFGVKAGPNIAWASGEVDGIDPIIGYHFGVFSWIKISERLKLKPEFVFSEQGFSTSMNSTNTITRIRYIQFPLLLEYHLDEVIFFAGPQVASIAGAQYLVKRQDDTEKIPASRDLNNIEYSGVVGIGVPIQDDLALQLRYQMSFSHMFDSTFDTFFISVPETKIRNQSLQLSITYTIP